MSPTQYEEFADGCVDYVMKLQEGFTKQYELAWYEDWFYHQPSGVFTLSKGEETLNFRYIEVGTFSTKTNTFKWSWDNAHTLLKVKQEMEPVKAFGEEYGIEELVTGLQPADEELAWKFTCIAAKLLGAKGCYRAPADHLLVFELLMDWIEPDTAALMKDKYMECATHNSARVAYVCQHLNFETKTGFNEAFDTDPTIEIELDEDYQAWCDACEQERLKAGEWNEESEKFAGIKLVCSECYFKMKKVNG